MAKTVYRGWGKSTGHPMANGGCIVGLRGILEVGNVKFS